MRGHLAGAGQGRRATRVLWLLGALAVGAVVLERGAVVPALQELARWLYGLGSAFYAITAEPLNRLRTSTTVPLLAPLLLGLMGATAPCQLSTGAAALAFVARDGRPGGALERAGAYLAARVLFYAVLGALVMYALGGAVQAPGALLFWVRRALGPLTLLIGLVTLGALRLDFGFGAAVSAQFQGLARARGGVLGAFALGLAYSLAFCPTLFLLFFGLTVPLALSAPLGALYPAAFAVGMTLPLLGLAWLVSSAGAASPDGAARSSGGYLRAVRGWRRLATPLAGVVFVLAGLYDTVVYWFT